MSSATSTSPPISEGAHSERIQPDSSIRCKAGYSEPSPTWSAFSERCRILSAIAYPCRIWPEENSECKKVESAEEVVFPTLSHRCRWNDTKPGSKRLLIEIGHCARSFLSHSPPTGYKYRPIPHTRASGTLTSKMFLNTPTRRPSSSNPKPLTNKPMTHREFSTPFRFDRRVQPQRIQRITNNTPRNTRNARCVMTGPEPPVPSLQPRVTAAATALPHPRSPAQPHPESPTRLQPHRYPSAPVVHLAWTAQLAGSRQIPAE
jgi:hypothetical protein